MADSLTNKFLLLSKRIFFNEIGTKFKPSLLKNLMDPVFVLFEKIGYKFEVISKNYLKMYEEVVNGEVKLAEISSKDNILVVGCGSLPATTALITKKTDANVLGIDMDSEAIKPARSFMKNLGLEDKVKIKNADGLNYSIKDFDVVFLLYGLKGQEKILKSFSKDLRDKSRIVFRLPSDMDQKNSEILNLLYQLFEVKDHKKSKSLGAVISYLLCKKN